MAADRRVPGTVAALLCLTMTMIGSALLSSQAFAFFPSVRRSSKPVALLPSSSGTGRLLLPPRGPAPAGKPSIRVAADAVEEGPPRSSDSYLVFGASAFALVAAAACRSSSRVTCYFRRRYGGGGVKFDYSAIPEYGPQYVGPKQRWGIQRDARLGFPKSGEGRVIPKLSGGSYDRRKNLMRLLTTQVIKHGRIKTTRARAEALRHFANRMIVLARRGDDLSMREAQEWMFDEKLVDNLFEMAAERYPDLKQKTFCRITPTMNRTGDWADMAYIELV